MNPYGKYLTNNSFFFAGYKITITFVTDFLTRSMAIQEDIISSLEEKIKRVIHVAEKLRANNGQLQQQIDELFGQLRAKNQEVEVLESKYQSLKLTKTMISTPDDIRSVKFQVSRMVREIDKCIALLNR